MSKNYYEMSAVSTAQIEIDYLRDEVARLKRELNDVDKARAMLKAKGYFTDNLWCISDVITNYDCSNDDAQRVLLNAMTSEATIDHIYFAIDDACSNLKIKKTNP